MLTPEEKQRIEAEERYRAELRGRQKPIRTRSFTDTMNKLRLVFMLIVFALMAGAAWVLTQPIK